jgi:hypothetical protein
MVRFQCSECRKFFNLVPPSSNCPFCNTLHMFLGKEVTLDNSLNAHKGEMVDIERPRK